MPSTSRKQHNLMAMVANDPKAAKRVGIPQSVGAEFMKADTGRKFARGGEMAESKSMMKREVAFMKKAGAPKSMVKHEESEMKTKKMAGGGDTTMSNPSRERRGMTMEKMGKVTAGGTKKFGEHSIQTKGHTRGKNMGDAGKTVGIMSGAKGMKRGGKC